MKPLMLKGHERSITKVRYNKDGDLLFSSGKDSKPSVWFSDNGERLGTYDGHKGVVWSLDVSYDSERLITGSGDNRCMLWDVETGAMTTELPAPTSVRCVGFSYSANLFFFTTMKQMKQASILWVFDIREGDLMQAKKPIMSIPLADTAFTAALWTDADTTIITGHEKGDICKYDIRSKSSEPVNFLQKPHSGPITDMQISWDETMIITASKDNTACLFDADSLNLLKTYKSDRPVNAAAMCPNRDHIVLGGGEEAMKVTTSSASQSQFEAKFYHMIFEDEFARLKGHFGPINTLNYHPDGNSFASGGEDGYVRIQSFDQDYHDFEFDF